MLDGCASELPVSLLQPLVKAEEGQGQQVRRGSAQLMPPPLPQRPTPLQLQQLVHAAAAPSREQLAAAALALASAGPSVTLPPGWTPLSCDSGGPVFMLEEGTADSCGNAPSWPFPTESLGDPVHPSTAAGPAASGGGRAAASAGASRHSSRLAAAAVGGTGQQGVPLRFVQLRQVDGSKDSPISSRHTQSRTQLPATAAAVAAGLPGLYGGGLLGAFAPLPGSTPAATSVPAHPTIFAGPWHHPLFVGPAQQAGPAAAGSPFLQQRPPQQVQHQPGTSQPSAAPPPGATASPLTSGPLPPDSQGGHQPPHITKTSHFR